MKPTLGEAELLAMILREVRHARATGEQLQITVDPHRSGAGANVFFGYSARGWSTEVGAIRSVRSRRGKTR